LWFDLDNEELQYAHKDAAALSVFLVERYAVEPGELLTFFSGSKGFHVGLSTALWFPSPSLDFHRVCRRFGHPRQALQVRLSAVCGRGHKRRPKPPRLPQVRPVSRLGSPPAADDADGFQGYEEFRDFA
jgi:hypothetical protein